MECKKLEIFLNLFNFALIKKKIKLKQLMLLD